MMKDFASVTLTITIAYVIAGIVMSVVVWRLVKKNGSPAPSHSARDEKKVGGPEMQWGHWLDAAVSIVVGVFLGIAIDGLVLLMTTAFWPLAVIMPLLAAAFFLLDSWFGRLIDKVFPNGIRAARKPKKPGRKPLLLVLSLPVGVVLGVVLARLGIGYQLVDWLS